MRNAPYGLIFTMTAIMVGWVTADAHAVDALGVMAFSFMCRVPPTEPNDGTVCGDGLATVWFQMRYGVRYFEMSDRQMSGRQMSGRHG